MSLSLKSLRLASPEPFRGSDWIGTVLRVALGVLLIWSGVPKLRAPRSFKQTVRVYDFSPEWLTKIVGYALPVLLLVLGIVLILGLITRLTAIVSTVVLFVLAVAAVQAAARGRHAAAGIFGVGGLDPSPSWAVPVLVALVAFLAAGFLALWPHTRVGVDDYLSRHDWVAEPSAKRLRDPQGRAKYERDVAAKVRSVTARNRYMAVAVSIVAVVVTLVGAIVMRNNASFRDVISVDAVSAAHGVTYGKAAAADVEIYEDFFSPQAADLAVELKDFIAKQVPANVMQVHYHLTAGLDHSPNRSGYSTRAANAALCAADVSTDFFVKYHNTLMSTDKQGQRVRPDSQSARGVADFLRYATDIGGMDDDTQTTFRNCVQVGGHNDLVAQLTESASRAGIGLTPVVFVNGKRLANPSLATLTKAVEAAAATGPAPDPSPTPTTTPATPTGTATGAASPTGAAAGTATGTAASPTGAAAS